MIRVLEKGGNWKWINGRVLEKGGTYVVELICK